MSAQASQTMHTWPFELRDWLQQLRSRTILFAMPALYILAALLLAAIELLHQPFGQVWVPIAAFGLVLALLILRKRSPLLAGWMLAMGSLAVTLAVAIGWGLSPAICLLAASAGLALLTISTTAGLAIAIACTLLLLFTPATLLPATIVLRMAALMAIWVTVGMVWLAVNPLLAAVQWAWSNYEEGRASLERARGYQAQLHEALEDLASANLQLTRLNQVANALRQVAEDERQAKEQFVANVSHELRTPLNMIIGFSEMICESPEAYGRDIPPALLADLSVVLRNSRHLSDLIDDVLDLSQIEAGRMALTKERVALPEIIEAATTAVRPLYESKGLYLRAEVPEDLPLVFCDRTRIQEVLLNLLSNAGRFTDQGGVRLRAWREDNDLVVSVADTGMGIAKEDQARLFQPFQQLDGTIRRRYSGTGLGLNISKSFVELHNGRMWMESQKGVGTTVFFRLPIDPQVPLDHNVLRWINPFQREGRYPRPSRLEPVPVAPRMLLWERGDAMRRLLSRYLGDVEIVPRASLEACVEELSRTPAAALLINASDISGALERLNACAALPEGTPAIICSVPGLEQATSTLGACDYLVKPVSREALLAALDRLGKEVKTILVVDDEQDALLLFCRMLSSANRGYRVLRACDGRQALQILREDRPDVVMLDLLMPEVSGFEFLAIRNQDAALRDIPVILISARDPFGQPVVSNALTVTRANGLSVQDLLSCIEALSTILSSAGLHGDRALKAKPPGSPVCE